MQTTRASMALKQPIRLMPGVPVRLPIGCLRTRPTLRPLNAAAPVEEVQYEETFTIESEEPNTKAFPYPLPKDSGQQLLSSIPLMLLYPGFLAAVAAAGYGGSLLGRAAPVDPSAKDVAAYGTAAVAAAAVAYGCVQAKRKRDSAAVVDLYNALVDLPDATDLTPETVSDVGSKYGINFQKDELDGLKRIYGQYLESVIPVGDVQLKGDEAAKVAAFKDILGLADEDAAPVHIEVGRRFMREGFETKDRNAVFEKRKAFQRLIYVSQVVFGDQKAAFLLPWRRTFNLNDAQIFVARRDNARAIFRQYLEARGGMLPADRHVLRELREKQTAIKLMDETAAEVVRDAARRTIESHLTRAIEVAKSTGKELTCAGKARDITLLVEEVDAVLEYDRKLVKYGSEDDLVAGLGMVTLHGGALDGEGRTRDLKDVFRLYLEEKLNRAGEFSAQMDADAAELATIMCMGAKETQALRDEVSAKLYRRLLKEEVTSGRLDSATSPASVLQSLCDKVRFRPEAALELHRQLYKAKLSALLEARRGHGGLTDGDVEDLKRIRRILCLPADVAKKVMRETAGREFEELVGEIYLAGAKPLGSYEAERVDRALKELRLDSDVAVEVMAQITRERFRSYVTQAQREGSRDRRDFAASVKKLLQFNALMVTPLLERVKGVDAAKKELAEMLLKAAEEAKKEEAAEAAASGAPAPPPQSTEDAVTQVRKAIQANRGEFSEEERKAQKEITLKDDLEPAMRSEIYKNYLMYSMSGEVVELPVGGVIRKKSSAQARQAEMTRLQALADVLGMSGAEVMSAQSDLAEQAYKAQASEVMRTGPLNEEKIQYLEEMRSQLGLSKEVGDKVLKAARTEVYGSSSAAEDGKWTVDRVLELHKSGGNVENLMEEVTRRNLFRREIIKKVTDGSGDADSKHFLHTLPAALALPANKVRLIVKEEVSTRKRMLLVQAVSQFRQRRVNEAVTSLQNLLSCVALMPEEGAIPWKERGELQEVYGLYCAKEDSASKRSTLQSVLGLSEEEAVEIAATASVDSAGKKKATTGTFTDDDDDSSFF
ncbi:hypothetical protein VOLCADRAFT_98450 [Volvox carteri f. nagariensis]|uniref:Uncharacterized protein n=1 Tax=Volvox carteri f. nagariensis TaxID=3068 RepID=D8UFD3_VOLCA|nr:uncharacterized protein VOLCADRAFT_98450 [Volvox carteri f. nagariensis]EFJ41589.1 hypothetical protein VOLCADRAFT_98450 [Volvox carteri f. nagariensis]|eukprot:XP_002957380.1 hypothetical protein VOLCADRAFT_98450 [Volvox carteri f. nagariensis]